MSLTKSIAISLLVGGALGAGFASQGKFPELASLLSRFQKPQDPLRLAAAAVPPPLPELPKGPRFLSLETHGPRATGIVQSAPAMSPADRRRKVMELIRAATDVPTEDGRIPDANLDIQVSALILDEDVYMHMETVIGGTSGLSVFQSKLLLSAAYRAGARYGMQELLDNYPRELAALRLPLTLTYIDEMAGRDVFKALELLARPEVQDEQAAGLTTALYTYAARKDAAKALALAGKIEAYPLRELAERGILLEMARKQGLAAAWAHTLQIPEDGARFRVQSAVIRAVGQLDPGKRAEMLQLLTDPNTNPALRNSAASGILKHWALTEPAAAFDWAVANLGAEARDIQVREILSAVLREYHRQKPEEVVAKLAALTPKLRGYLNSVVTQAAAEAEPEPLPEVAAAPVTLPAPAAQVAYDQNSMIQLTRADPQKALALLPQISQEDRANAIFTVFSTWAASDPVAAGQWIAQQPADTVRDRAIDGLISTVGGTDPEGAAAWIKETTAGFRYWAIRRLVSAWADADPHAARTWLNANSGDLTPKQTFRLNEVLDRTDAFYSAKATQR